MQWHLVTVLDIALSKVAQNPIAVGCEGQVRGQRQKEGPRTGVRHEDLQCRAGPNLEKGQKGIGCGEGMPVLRLFKGATGSRHPASAEGTSLVPVGPESSSLVGYVPGCR